jgi:urate oxidase
MNARLGSQTYGKSLVRLSRVTRHADRHDFSELGVSITLDGDFSRAYTHDDNRLVIPTDTMKNTVYVLAHERGVDSIEGFSLRLGRHFVDSYSHVNRSTVFIEQKPWTRLELDGTEHPHCFVMRGGEHAVCRAVSTPEGETLRSGLTGLRILKTTGSGFSGFHQDQYTTLQDTDDRILATTIDCWWDCRDPEGNWTDVRHAVRTVLLTVFARQFSASVQSTLYRMASSALEVCPSIDDVSITMPNQHHLLANLGPFGLQNENETFVPIDEPHGVISAVVRRSESSEAP